MEEYISIGALKKAHGVKGELKFFVQEQYIEDLQQIEVFFLKIKGNPIPYFIEYFRFSNAPIIKFEDIDTKEAASKISSLELFARQKDLLTEEERSDPLSNLQFSYLTGFTMIDDVVGTIGIIDEVVEYPQQEMAVVLYNDREVLIPLNAALIQKEEKNNKQLFVELPEGLLDL